MYLGKQEKRYQVIPLNHSLEFNSNISNTSIPLPLNNSQTPPPCPSKTSFSTLKALINL